LVQNKMYQTRYGDEWMYDTADRLVEFAREYGSSPAALAVAWVAGHPAVTAAIVGGRSVDQLEESLESLEIEMTPELRARLSSLSPEPPPATDRNEERTPHRFAVR
jgi:aryl-alcohol dehydrogenase-like predicted oxidoreductase